MVMAWDDPRPKAKKKQIEMDSKSSGETQLNNNDE